MRDLCWIRCFCCFSGAFQSFSCTFHEKHHFSYKECHFSWVKTRTRSIYVYTCTIYTYMHHQIPPKYKIYLVGLPSVLYERPGQNERSVLNQLFLLLFRCFSCAFHEKFTTVHTKSTTVSWKQTKHVNMCVYMHHLHMHAHMHHQIPPKYKIYLVGLPSVLYETPGQNKRSVLNQLFLLLFSAFHRKCWFSYKKCHFSWKQTKPGQYVCIHAPFIHTCTTT